MLKLIQITHQENMYEYEAYMSITVPVVKSFFHMKVSLDNGVLLHMTLIRCGHRT